jgi:hydroxypyruvate reductase
MAVALLAQPALRVQSALAIGTHPAAHMPATLDFMSAGHPYPDERSRAAAAAALERARGIDAGGHLVLLISGGASALMCDAAEGVSFEEKLAATRAFMLAGADIHQLNALRKHLSRVKGGWLASACRGVTTTLALSDVVGDDLSVIGSGPGLPDPSTWSDVAAALTAHDAWGGLPRAVRDRVTAGCDGLLEDTPKPGDPRLARAEGFVVGRAADALSAARLKAEALGYRVRIMEERVTGEAREVAPEWLRRALTLIAGENGPVCVLSSGETTVRVTGPGVGGRNLEFALALAELMRDVPDAVAASVGTDGIDGTSGVAGGWVDADTVRRAVEQGMPRVTDVLDRNDSFNFLAPLGNAIRTGRTDTNVGDLQLLFVNP